VRPNADRFTSSHYGLPSAAFVDRNIGIENRFTQIVIDSELANWSATFVLEGGSPVPRIRVAFDSDGLI
jgi:hypothetical protein